MERAMRGSRLTQDLRLSATWAPADLATLLCATLLMPEMCRGRACWSADRRSASRAGMRQESAAV